MNPWFKISKTDSKGTFLFEIHWEPEDEGMFREMILFVVDNSYRLQGFVFGSVEAAPKKKIVVCILF
jgi:hypothetical protein